MLKRLLFRFSIFYLPVLLLSVGWTYTVIQNKRQELLISGQAQVLQKRSVIIDVLRPLVSNIHYWSQYSFSDEAFSGERKDKLADQMLHFMDGIENYHQFRLLDPNGVEVLRLRRNENGIVQHDSILQDKSHRPYFIHTIELQKGQIYLSELNLNQEFNQFEYPYRPVFRGSSPVFNNQGERIGVVIINYSAASFLSSLQVDSNLCDFYLVDNQGRYIGHKDFNTQIAALKHLENSPNIFNDFPSIEDELNANKQAFYNESGLWIINHLVPTEIFNKNSNWQTEDFELVSPNDWRLISHIPENKIQALLAGTYWTVVYFNLSAILVLLIISYFTENREQARIRYTNLLQESNNQLSKANDSLTEKARIQNELSSKLEVRNRQLVDYNTIVSHNLRAPTTSLTALTTLMVETGPGEEMNELLPKLKSVSDSLNSIVDDLLEHVQLFNHQEPDLSSFDFEEVLFELKHEFGEKFSEIRGLFEYDVSEWSTIHSSRIELKEVLRELIVNAIRFKSQDRYLLVSVRTALDSGHKRILVSDNGLGLDLGKHHHHVFKLHKLFHRDISQKGTGLFEVKTRLEAIGARIEISSIVNVGTTFTITLKDS